MRLLSLVALLLVLGTAMAAPCAASTTSAAQLEIKTERELRGTSGEHLFVLPGEDWRDPDGGQPISGNPHLLTGAEAALVGELGDAKRRGDDTAVRRLENELAALQGRNPEFVAQDADDPSGTIVVPGGEGGELPGRWTDDVPVMAGVVDEGHPSMATDSNGNRYMAIEALGDSLSYIWVYRSTDNGQSWLYWTAVYSPGHIRDFTDPSLAIGEGNEDWLLLTYVDGGRYIMVWRFALDTPSTNSLVTVEDDILGVSHPRIVTDTDEYSFWYGYLVWNAGWLGMRQDFWVLRFSRTTDYGATWTAPTTLANYCQHDYYDAGDAHPDLDFGNVTLHVVYDNYPPGCVGPNRDVYLRSSSNYGSSWGAEAQLTDADKDEYDPRVAAVKSDTSGTVMVGYTRDWGTDNDVLYKFSQDGGASWGTTYCLACTFDEEKAVDLTTSSYHGMVHAAFWHEYDVIYGGADYQYLAASYWNFVYPVNEDNWASSVYPRPTIEVNPTFPPEQEAGIAWTDFRNPSYDVYFDAAVRTDVGKETPAIRLSETGSARPNPSRGATTIGFALTEPEAVTMRIFDASGRLVRVLADGAYRPAGEHEFFWDGRDSAGRPAGAGVYFCRLETGTSSQTKRIVVVH